MSNWLPQHIRDGDLPRACTKCKKLKPASKFHKRPNGRRRECITCWATIHKARDQGPATRAKYQWRKRNNKKSRAHGLLAYHVKTRKIIRPDNCARCKTKCIPHGHHHDYSKPLDVDWLCSGCHKLEHINV